MQRGVVCFCHARSHELKALAPALVPALTKVVDPARVPVLVSVMNPAAIVKVAFALAKHIGKLAEKYCCSLATLSAFHLCL